MKGTRDIEEDPAVFVSVDNPWANPTEHAMAPPARACHLSRPDAVALPHRSLGQFGPYACPRRYDSLFFRSCDVRIAGHAV